MELTEEQKSLVQQFQFYQQQLQAVIIQKESVKSQKLEVTNALEELQGIKEEKVYKIVGNIMVSRPVEEVRKQLLEEKEALEVKEKSLEKSEEKIINKLKELQEKLKGIVGE